MIGDLDVLKVCCLLFNPREVFLDVPGVDNQHVAIFSQVINKQVINRVAVGQAELGIERLAYGETGDIIGDEILQESERARSFGLKFAHVTDVEEACAGAYSFVLLQDTAILDRHLPAAKLDHLRAEFEVGGVKRCALQARHPRATVAVGSEGVNLGIDLDNEYSLVRIVST